MWRMRCPVFMKKHPLQFPFRQLKKGREFDFNSWRKWCGCDSNEDEGDFTVIQVSFQTGSDFRESLAKRYKSDREPKHVSAMKSNPDVPGPYRWDSISKKLFWVTEDRERLCIPKDSLRTDVLRLCHDVSSAGHTGRDRTYSKVSREYYWPPLGRDVARYVRPCPVCQFSKGDRLAMLLCCLCLCHRNIGRTYQWISLLAFQNRFPRTTLF